MLISVLASQLATRGLAANVDPAKVEGAINLALRSSGLAATVLSRSITVGDVRTSDRDPELLVDSIDTKRETDVVIARVRCRQSRECLPFFVLARVRTGAGHTPIHWSAKRAGQAVSPPIRTSVRAGDSVIFVAERSDSRLRVQGVALERGCIGDVIRVRSRGARPKIFQGAVAGQGIVRGEL